MDDKMKIVYLPLDKITPYDDNPRNNKEAIKHVAKSIKEYGFRVPMVLDKRNVIITGHTRYFAAKKLGLEEVPCIIAADMPKSKVKAFRLADNRVAEYSEWDDTLLKKELDALSEAGYDLGMTGFNDFELMEIMDDIKPDKFDKSEYEEYGENAASKLKSFNCILMCMTEADQRYLKKLLRVGKDEKLKRTYTVADIKQRRTQE
jgi:hypothetical protein